MQNFRKKFRKKTAFLTPGWWLIHFIGIAGVYTLGNVLWK